MQTIAATDEQLLQEFAASGAPEVFGELFSRWHSRLVGVIYHRVCHKLDDAHEIVQLAFVKLWRYAGRFRAESAAFTWMVSIAINCARDLRRRTCTKKREAKVTDPRLLGVILDSRPWPEDVLSECEDRQQFAAAINSLSPKQRAVIVLLDINGDDYEVAARKLCVPIGTIRSRRHRALNQLRKLMAA